MKFFLVVIFSIIIITVSPAFAAISLDKSPYTWTDKINIRITEHGVDSDGASVRVYTEDHEIRNYKLAKAGNGLYTGEIILTGFLHDVNGDGKYDTNPRTTGTGPNNGFLESSRDDEFTILVRFADGDEIKKSVKINWNVGTMDYTRMFNGYGESFLITVNDPDMNLNPDTLDTLSIQVFSDSDKAGLVIDAKELHDSPGTFVAYFSTSQDDSSGRSLYALPDDVIYVQYDDHTLPKPYSVNDDLAVSVELHPFPFEQLDAKNIEWSQANYSTKNGTSSAKIIVTDHEQNKFANSIDTVKAKILSDSSLEGITIDLYETSKDSGVFERTFAFSDKRSGPNILYGNQGDTMTALYDPQQSIDSKNFLTATTLLGSTGPPLERAPVSAPRISDLKHNTIVYPVVGEQVLLTSDIANQQDREQRFVWIAQIIDSDKKTQALSWIDGTLNPLSSFSPATSWIPNVAGDYRVVFFVWQSIENPTALSPPIEFDFTVLDEDPTRHHYEELTPDDLEARQNMIEELRTVPGENSMDHLSDDARDFVISEVLKNNKVSSILDGYTYDVECCSFSVDRKNPPLNQHVGLKFNVEEKYLFVTVTFDLKQEKITAILKGSSDGFSIIPVDDKK
ncbi:hypothetical protein [Nitrosopumilus maritimus]|uniref:Uncharacterized protein n=1 Tax=Nitrosopumilus maritimus (strain SCM1) TaxID=436308 RepID=A9A3U6_NITMS|nr:hypothetical protein [Nitrosopumilus maritimus]ABX13358.1 hypothetical protein Nmar_1462 [Nitrosopumilus maritimus SCM1]